MTNIKRVEKEDAFDFLNKCTVISMDSVPIWLKQNLTIKEASKLFNIGINKLYELTDDEDCGFVLYVGSKRLIKREKFAQYLELNSTYSI